MYKLIFTNVDYVIISIITFSSILSVFRGFVKEALSLVLWIMAIALAASFNGVVSEYLADSISIEPIRYAVATFGLFFVIMFIGSIINNMISKLVQSIGLGSFDRLIGFVFGLARGTLIVLALVMTAPYLIDVENEQWWLASSLIPYFEQFKIVGADGLTWMAALLMNWIF